MSKEVGSQIFRWEKNQKHTFLEIHDGGCFPQFSHIIFLVLDHFSLKNGPNDLVRGLFLSSDIGPNILSTCGPLYIFSGNQMAPKWP
jgi:hypothetical protein